MKRIKANVPTADEFEEIMLGIDGDIVEVREEADNKYFVMYIGKHLVEVPYRWAWRIREKEEAE